MIIVITEVAILLAAKYFVSPRLPINPVSTTPTKGIARLEKITGMDSKKIFFLELLGQVPTAPRRNHDLGPGGDVLKLPGSFGPVKTEVSHPASLNNISLAEAWAPKMQPHRGFDAVEEPKLRIL